MTVGLDLLTAHLRRNADLLHQSAEKLVGIEVLLGDAASGCGVRRVVVGDRPAPFDGFIDRAKGDDPFAARDLADGD